MYGKKGNGGHETFSSLAATKHRLLLAALRCPLLARADLNDAGEVGRSPIGLGLTPTTLVDGDWLLVLKDGADKL